MTHPKTVMLVMCGLLLTATAGAHADITVDSWVLSTVAREAGNPQVAVVEIAPPVTLPFSGVSTAIDGDSQAMTTFDFDAAGDFGSFHLATDHVRSGTPNSAAVSVGHLYFSVSPDADLLYSLAGEYAMLGNGHINLLARLYDATTTTVVFWSQQASENTLNESFVLGETGQSDTTNDILIGSPFGTLTAGHEYVLWYQQFIARPGFPDSDAGASAAGSMSLEIFPIPAPAAALLAILGLPLVVWVKRRAA